VRSNLKVIADLRMPYSGLSTFSKFQSPHFTKTTEVANGQKATLAVTELL
jgi:hypothetical protein